MIYFNLYTSSRRCLCILAFLLLGTAPAPAQDFDLMAMSLDELMNIQVFSAAKKDLARFDVPAAISIITRDDIQRSGLTTVAEVLRLAPGTQVGRIDVNKWGITIRGFNGRFSNKLLVLIDGRSVYTPVFAGVYWRELDVQNIERIEIVRGPGGAVWGANAVNGIVNIITRRADDTQGWKWRRQRAAKSAPFWACTTAASIQTRATTASLPKPSTAPPRATPAAAFATTGRPTSATPFPSTANSTAVPANRPTTFPGI